ncbi:MAG: CapA family protein [Leptospiraceae bacterium]|nr:CapA family protein [Leptospiraceae bacterium]
MIKKSIHTQTPAYSSKKYSLDSFKKLAHYSYRINFPERLYRFFNSLKYLLFGYCSVLFLFTQPAFSEVQKRPRTLKILVAGDVMFNWGLRETRQKKGEFAPVEGLVSLFEEADLRMVNLETPVANSQEEMDDSKSYVFNAKPEDLSLLKKINVDLVFLGNNHSMDYGKKGLEDTMENLKKENILFAGMGKNITAAFSPTLVSIRNNPFHIISVSNIGESRLFASDSKPGIAPLQIEKLRKIINEKESEKKVNLLSVHWGIEYNPEPTKQQIKQAHDIINMGFSAVIGHHPHIPQGVEKYKNGIIIYSLGNFIFGSRNQYLNHNIAVMLHFENQELVFCEIIPIFGKFQNAEHLVKPLPYLEAEDFLHEYSILCQNLNTKIEIKNGRGYIYFKKRKN